jgi:hypothetical protein
MTQSRTASAVEAVANVAIGFGIAWLATLVVLPAVGVPVNAAQGFWITCAFTVISLVRSYLLRRLFNRLHAASLAR